MLMIHVNDPLQISRGIFVWGEIIKMHTIHQRKYTVMKLPRNVNSKAKKINKKTIQFETTSSTSNGMNALYDFSQIIHSQIDTRHWKTHDILNTIKKGSVFGLDDYQFENTASHECVVQKAKSL